MLYKRQPGVLRYGGNTLVTAGEVLRLGRNAIHPVSGEGEGESHAIHVYEGPLKQVSRSLLDWTTGEDVEFTMENLHAMARRKTEMVEFQRSQ